jgi:hypothetical protein
MWWARSRLLNIDIEASRANQWPGSFVCPCCARSVDLRCGPIVEPYFAHRRGEGTEDCENYHPPSRLRQAIGLSQTTSRPTGEARELPFLAVRGHAPLEAELVVRIPRAESSLDWAGSVLLDTGLGEMTIGAHAAEQGSWAPISPLRHYAVTASGDVDPDYASKFTDSLLALDPTGSLFRYGEGIQRQLSDGEQIFWGCTYWLVGLASALQLSAVPASLDIDIADLRSPWVIALVTLPPYSQVPGDQARLAERWLKQSIGIGRDTLSFVHPLPHHFASDGTPVFEADTRTLRLRCPVDATLLVVNEAGRQAEIAVRPLTDDCEVHISESGNWRVLLGGRHAGYIRLEDCSSLTPPRVQLEVDGEAALLPSLESEALLRKAIQVGKAIQVAADADNLRELVTLNGATWPASESLVWTVGTAALDSMDINVRGVGAVGSARACLPSEKMPLPDLEVAASWLWSLSCPARTRGASVHMNLPVSPLPPVIRRLEGRRWHRRFAAHVRVFQARLNVEGLR